MSDRRTLQEPSVWPVPFAFSIACSGVRVTTHQANQAYSWLSYDVWCHLMRAVDAP